MALRPWSYQVQELVKLALGLAKHLSKGQSIFWIGIEPMTWGGLYNQQKMLQSPALPTELPEVMSPT